MDNYFSLEEFAQLQLPNFISFITLPRLILLMPYLKFSQKRDLNIALDTIYELKEKNGKVTGLVTIIT